ncbi:right-handed parallel beta-helix repeat-containing protein [Jiangella endophytica]|uniref:right-handed parallel beta-helix repeat-containing protein n=1 Tax=Jiangella endophytica TaxID=1623398 RepID=UPI000E355FDB|nr:right-handed parallel beta-helix repeat-containing protein [Jiangella endophytica]
MITRRTFLAGTVGAVPVAMAAGAAPAVATRRRRSGTCWYLSSSDGDDVNTGTSPADAWSSLARLDTALTSGEVVMGDTVRLKAGDEFFGSIRHLPAATAGPERLTITSYGAGSAPRVSAYKICDVASAWTQTSPSVWTIDLTDATAFTGNTGSMNADVGFLRVDGEIFGAKKWAAAELAAQWDFYSDQTAGLLHVRSEGNPTTHGDVRCAVDEVLVVVASHTTVEGLELVGTGGHAVRALSATEAVVRNNVIHEVGGSSLGGTTRYGNGVEIWIGCSDILIDANEIFDVYDVAITYQGPQEGAMIGWTDVHATNNTIRNCTQSFEVWSRGTDVTSPGAGFTNCTFSDNLCEDAGFSWAMPVRPDKNGVHLLFYYKELPTDIRIERNEFRRAYSSYCYFSGGSPTPPELLVASANIIELAAGTKIQYQRTETIEQSAAWTAATGLDTDSTFIAG